MKSKFVIILFLIGILAASDVSAQQHDHQDWNLLSIGRLVTLARTNSCLREKTTGFECGVASGHEAMTKMDELLSNFDCTAFGKEAQPSLSHAIPFTRHDHGPVIVAEVEDVTCKTLPSTHLMPVAPEEFKKYCSRLEWKCDTVWIPDSDPSVWYIGVLANIPSSR